MTQSHKHRGTGALTDHGRRRGWGSVGPAAPIRSTPHRRSHRVLRPAHELRPASPTRPRGLVLVPGLISLLLALLHLAGA